MLASVRPYATAGIALVGASVIAIAPIVPSQLDSPVAHASTPTVNADVNLAAASIFNAPTNLFNALLNSPAAMVAGLERFAAAMAASGSWNESHPNNVWGWDDANPEHAKGSIDLLVPIPSISTPLGEAVNWWLAANLPMHEGCAFQCPDLGGMLGSMFKVPIWEFWDEDGYTFPVVINPVSGLPTPWSEQQVILDPWAPVKSFVDYLMDDPGQVHFPTGYEIITAVANFAASLQITGHLPTWIAVREIETFFKLFVPKPAQETVEVTPPAPEADLQSVTFDVDTLRVGGADARPVTDEDDASIDSTVHEPTDAASTTPQGSEEPSDADATLDTADVPVSAATPVEVAEQEAVDVDETESAAESDAETTEDLEPASDAANEEGTTGGFDPAQVVKSLNDRFSAATQTAAGGLERDGADRGAQAESDAPAKGGADNSDSGSKGADD